MIGCSIRIFGLPQSRSSEHFLIRILSDFLVLAALFRREEKYVRISGGCVVGLVLCASKELIRSVICDSKAAPD